MAQGWYELLRRTNYTDLRPWFPRGVEALREAAVRDKLAALGTSLWERIQRARRATGVPGNLRRLNPHFIGRRTELRQLHENLALGAVGVVTAVHGLGGQGKTELATAYAHGWADSYPAGLWVLGAEGRKEILPLLGELCAELNIPLSTSPDESADARGRRVIAELKRRAAEVKERDPDKGAATLVILDNVSEPSLLAEPQLAHIPREDWLRVVVTTREGPEKFPASRKKSLAFIAVDALSEDDAARLIEDHQIETGGQWPAATASADVAAALEIARELGGFTLAVESVAIYLGLHPDIRPAAYLARLRAEGLTGVDALPADADVAAQMQHREKQLRLVLDQTLARLTPAERTALDYAALLPPDSIPWPWLRELVAQEHKEMRDPDAERQRMLRQFQNENPQMAALLDALTQQPELIALLKSQTPADAPEEHRQALAELEKLVARPAARAGYPDPWPALRRRLEGLRLLTPGDHVEVARLHRMVAAHLRERLAAAPPAAHQVAAGDGSEGQRPGHKPAQGNALGSGAPHEISPERAAQNPDVPPLQGSGESRAAVPGALPQAGLARPVGAERLDAGDGSEGQRPGPKPAQGNALGSDAQHEISPERAAQMVRRLREVAAQMASQMEHSIDHHTDDLWMLLPLQESIRHLDSGKPDELLALAADVVGGVEMTIGRLDTAFDFLCRAEKSRQILHDRDRHDANAARSLSVTLNNLGDFLSSRGQPGDAEKALGHYQRSLEVAERLLAANPESAEAARDVWVSCWRMASMAENTGAGYAMKWWRKAFAILDGMKREGRFMTPQDEGFHEQLRRKVGR
jgi:hypothetical protein